MTKVKLLGLFLLMAMLCGCGIEVPPEKAAYVGQWHSPQMSLTITQAGRVEYKRAKDGVSTSVSGPIKKFDGNNFEVGIGFMSTAFVVSKPPYQDGDKWKMVVDGEELTRTTQ
jgi:hypothetical protein